MEAVSVSLYCLLLAVFTAEQEPLFLFKQNVLVLFVLTVQKPNFNKLCLRGFSFTSCFFFLLFRGNVAVNKYNLVFCPLLS